MWRHYLAYTRPRAIPATFVTSLTGYALSPQRPREPRAIAVDLALLLLVHAVLLWGGTNAFNSAHDRDEGPVNLLPDPPPLPPHLGAFGLALKAAATGIAALVGWRPALLVAGAAVLSFYYSARVPWWRRGKEIGVVDNLINAVGGGFGSVLFGWVMTPAPLDARALVVGVGFSLAYFGGVPTSQLFQLRPGETYAEARNYTALLGPARTLRVGPLFFVLHVAVLGALALADGRRFGALELGLWLGWAALVVASAVHSWRWAAAPFDRPYVRMLRQLTMLMASQVLWTGAAWLGSR